MKPLCRQPSIYAGLRTVTATATVSISWNNAEVYRQSWPRFNSFIDSWNQSSSYQYQALSGSGDVTLGLHRLSVTLPDVMGYRNCRHNNSATRTTCFESSGH